MAMPLLASHGSHSNGRLRRLYWSRVALLGLLGDLRLLGTPLYATLVVNVVGCLVIGFLGGLAEERQYPRAPAPPIPLRRHPRRLHTFSSVAYETAQILRAGQVPAALVHIGLQLLLGIPAVFVGYGRPVSRLARASTPSSRARFAQAGLAIDLDRGKTA